MNLPAPVAVFDRDPARRRELTEALRETLPRVLDGDEVESLPPEDAHAAAGSVAALVALSDVDLGVITRLRVALPSATVFAVAALTPALTPPPGSEALALAQRAGCDGCLLYHTPEELVATLLACVSVPS